MNFKVCEAIVIKGMRYNETSKILSLFTDEFGKVNFLAKGVRNAKSNQCGVFEEMNHIRIYFNNKINRSLQVINKSENISTYKNIKSDLEKLEYAFRIIEIMNNLTFDFDSSSKLFNLLKNVLYLLNSDLYQCHNVYLYFQLNFADLSGVGLKFHPYLNENSDKIYETFSEKKEFNIYDNIFDKQLVKILGENQENIENYKFNKSECAKFIGTIDDYLHQNIDSKYFFKSKYIFQKINRI
jgi:DNA repair protein RecO (recombination protein O)